MININPDLYRKKILLVDDDSEWLDYLSDLLMSSGMDHFLDIAKDGIEALPLIKDVDLVITDTNMPRMDGVNLLKRIRTYRPELPVILFFSLSRDYQDPPQEIIQSKNTTILDKSNVHSELLPLVTQYLGLH